MPNSLNQDYLTKKFVENSRHFCDIINGFIFAGKRVANPNNLAELNAEMKTAVARHKKWIVARKVRDVFKRVSMKKDDNAIYALVGVENQQYVDYSMPVRAMLYDAIAYSVQTGSKKQAARQKFLTHPKSARQKSAGEYLYGFCKDDTLLPVVTIVINWGNCAWDGARSIHELFGEIKCPELLKHIPNHHFMLIDPRNLSDQELEHFSTDVRRVFECIKYSSDKELLSTRIHQDPAYASMDPETVKLINCCTGAKIPTPAKHSKEKVNMCKAIEEMIEDGFKKGESEGFKKGESEGFKKGESEGFIRGKEQGESEGFKKGRDSILKALQAGGYSANELNQMMSIVAQAETI